LVYLPYFQVQGNHLEMPAQPFIVVIT
jgi:hypothetical protein